MCDKICLKFRHSGWFKHLSNGDLVYEGGRGKSKQIDPDFLSFFDIIELAKECCGESNDVAGLYYLLPGLSMTNGLRKVHDDVDVMEVARLGVKYRCVELYVKHRDESPELDPFEEPEVQRHFQPLTQASQSAPQPSKTDSPLRLDQLVESFYSDEDDQGDPLYNPLTDKGKGVLVESSQAGKVVGGEDYVFGGVYTDEDSDEDDVDLEVEQFKSGLDGLDAELEEDYNEAIFEDGELYDSDVSDEEYDQARERVKSCTTQLVQAAAQLAKEAVEGSKALEVEVVQDKDSEHESEYDESAEEENTPPPSDDEGVEGNLRKRSSFLTGRGQSQTSAAAASQSVGLSQSTEGRGGRAGGRGKTMGGRGSGRGHTRGGRGRGRGPIGVGVLFGADGSVLPNVRGKSAKELSGAAITMKTRAASSQQAYNVMTGDSSSHKTTKHHQAQ
uniref:PB1-like domain-containing protein n=1 Tax=Chenopodium quinoa TaxID=63459 RepID=A0A803MV18_CHEQI